MANVNAPFGVMPLMRNISGGLTQANPYTRLAASAAIYQNDVVRRLTDASIVPGGTAGTDLWLGVSLNHGIDAVNNTVHQVIDNPDALFVAQDDGTSSGVLAADLPLNANLVFTAADTTLLLSKHSIASSTKAATATLDLKLRALTTDPIFGNDFGQYARIEVMFNKHLFTRGGSGI